MAGSRAAAFAAFLGIGAGARARARAPDAETDTEMARRHARERRRAGFAPQTPEDRDDERHGEDDHVEDDERDRDRERVGEEGTRQTDADREREREGEEKRARRARAGDMLPGDDDVDPDAPPPELAGDEDLLDEDDDAAEEDEDEAIDAEPDQAVRQARRRRARRARRAKARRRERMRCAAIFQDVAAAKNPALAAELAFNTTLSSARAILVLRRGGGSGLAARMAGLEPLHPGPGGVAPSARGAGAASWDAVLKSITSFS